MNLVLLENHEFLTESEARVAGRKAEHIRKVLKAKEGQTIKVGRLGGKMGVGTVASIGETVGLVDLTLNEEAPAKLPVRLIVALPRPKVFRRIVEIVATLGVPEIIFVNAAKVDKAYWSSHLVDEGLIRERSILGLEQAGDTILPIIKFERLFKPFVEDRLSDWCGDVRKFVAHPSLYPFNAGGLLSGQRQTVIAVGPEGGWTEYELNKLSELGFENLSLGQRTYKVETAIQLLASPFVF